MDYAKIKALAPAGTCPGCGAEEVELLHPRTMYACGTSSYDDRPSSWRGPCADRNCCEHGDHPAPPGKRFCSLACAKCERTECDESHECAGVCCGRPTEIGGE